MDYLRFIKYKWLYFAISLIIGLPGVFSLVRYGLRLSIDFTVGSLLEIQTRQVVDTQKITDLAASHDLELSSVQPSSDQVYFLRTKPITEVQKDDFVSSLNLELGGVFDRRFETVGPVVGAEAAKKAAFAVVLASVCIILYIAWSFRHIPKPYSPWKFGLCAIAALIH